MSGLSADFPRLAYVGDVPVEASYHGSALLYRLFQEYPRDRLLIVEPRAGASTPKRRLPGVSYQTVTTGHPRLLYSRIESHYRAFLMRWAPSLRRQITAAIKEFGAEAIVSVTHGHTWLAAAEVARRMDLPLHLVLHDEWIGNPSVPGWSKRWARREFGMRYRQAVSRFCVSPAMEEAYRRSFGVAGQVLYPSRAKDSPATVAPLDRPVRNTPGPVWGYAGTIAAPGYAQALRLLASVLNELGGRLLIFGPLSADQAAEAGLSDANIHLEGLVPSNDLIHRLRKEVDALFVPMSFDAATRLNMEYSFPSKLADYTAVGVPLLIRGPQYCSAVRWAMENEGVAEVVSTEDPIALRNSVTRLVTEPDRRRRQAERAIEVGRQFFAYEIGFGTFIDRINRFRSAKARPAS